jgi:hypothetical protein
MQQLNPSPTNRLQIWKILGVLFLVFSGIQLAAQIAAGGVTGRVTDPTGAVVANATVELTNVATNTKQTTRSSKTGNYSLTGVAPGTYRLVVQAPKFEAYAVEGLEVHVQIVDTRDVTLTVGKASDTVTVTSDATLLQAQSGAITQTIGTKMVNDLPLVSRDWVSLAQLSPGVATAPPNTPSTDSGTTGSAYFSSNGVNLWQNDIRLNGIDDNVEIYGGSTVGSNAAITPPPDAIQEFALQSGDFNAEFGHSTGAVINAVIKSGTNHIHGDIWEYIRNDAFNAYDYFSKRPNALGVVARRPEYRYNQFGGTVGGPIIKDRLFFFGDYQGSRIVIPVTYNSTVPTTLMQSSNFTNLQDLINFNTGTTKDGLGRTFPHGTVLDPATTRSVAAGAVDPRTGLMNTATSAVNIRDPFYTGSLLGMTNFVGQTAQLNVLPAGRLDPNAVKLLQLYPAQINSGLSNNYPVTLKEPQNINTYDIRIDANLSKRDQIFGVYDRALTTYSVPAALPGLAVGQNGGRQDSFPAYAIAAGYTHEFTPNLINELHFGMDHSDKNQISIFGDQMGIPAQYGIQGIPQIPNNGGLPAFGISGLTGLGVATYSPTVQATYDIEISDNLTRVQGNHQFKMGYQFDYLRGNIVQPPYGRGSFSYNGQYSDVPASNSGTVGVADMLLVPTTTTVANGINYLGGPQSYVGSNYSNNQDKRYYEGAYFQDDWKATSRLTLNLGLRWDYFTPYTEVNGRQANIILNGNGNGAGGTMYMPNSACAIPRSASFNTLIAASNITLNCTSNNALGVAQKYNFAPRLGFAYRVKNNLVLRGGYGLAYGGLGNIGFGGNLGNAYPFLYTINQSQTSPVAPLLLPDGVTRASFENTFGGVNLSDPTLVNGSGLSLYGREWFIHTPYTQTFNLTTQYQFSAHNSFQASYVGTTGRHLDNLTQHNSISEILPPGLSQTPYLPLPSFSANSTYERFNGESSYNSLQATFQRDMRGMTMLWDYTYSKCLSNQRTQSSAASGYRAQWLPGFGISPDYNVCDTDTTHVVHLAGTNDLPFGHGRQFMNHSSALVDSFLGGWNVNYIFSYQSGQPFSVGCPTSTTTGLGCNAFVQKGVSVYAKVRNSDHWLNPAAFIQPPKATVIGQTDFTPLGSSGQQARGPGFTNMDASVFKTFALPKSLSLQLRAEAFNAFNNAHLGQPGNLNFATSTTFSNITGLRGGASNAPRRLQFAVKIMF